MADFIGTWERVKHENMGNYLEVLGLPDQVRDLALAQKEMWVLSKEGDVWRTRYIPGDGKVEETAEFKVGEPAEYVTITGAKATGQIKGTGDANTPWTESHNFMGHIMDITREMVDGQMVVNLTTNGVSCKAWYDKRS